WGQDGAVPQVGLGLDGRKPTRCESCGADAQGERQLTAGVFGVNALGEGLYKGADSEGEYGHHRGVQSSEFAGRIGQYQRHKSVGDTASTEDPGCRGGNFDEEIRGLG